MPWTIERKHDHVAVVTMNTNKVNAQNPVFFADLHELTLLGRVYDLAAVVKMGVISKTAAPGRLLDDAVAWAALVPPDCYPAYAFTKRALQATTMAAMDAAARFDRDWLSRGMSDPASLRAQARRYRELKGREITWALPS